MKFLETKIQGVYIIKLEKIEDERGYFARTFDKKEFLEMGLTNNFIQYSLSCNKKKGTLRGMHFQREPYSETKIVSCVKGKIFDVIVDVRKESPTFKQWESNELDSDNHAMLYIPNGIAHGFQTLVDNTELLYLHSNYYEKNFEGGIRFDDKILSIDWPIKNKIISKRDKSHPNLIL